MSDAPASSARDRMRFTRRMTGASLAMSRSCSMSSSPQRRARRGHPLLVAGNALRAVETLEGRLDIRSQTHHAAGSPGPWRSAAPAGRRHPRGLPWPPPATPSSTCSGITGATAAERRHSARLRTGARRDSPPRSATGRSSRARPAPRPRGARTPHPCARARRPAGRRPSPCIRRARARSASLSWPCEPGCPPGPRSSSNYRGETIARRRGHCHGHDLRRPAGRFRRQRGARTQNGISSSKSPPPPKAAVAAARPSADAAIRIHRRPPAPPPPPRLSSICSWSATISVV